MSTLHQEGVAGSYPCICDDCGLSFESEGQLANHKHSFCATYKQLSAAGELSEKLAKMRADNKRKVPALTDLHNFLRIQGQPEEAFSEPHKELAALPVEMFREAVQSHEVDTAQSRAKLRVVRDEKLREEAHAQRHVASGARREREQLDAAITAAVHDFERHREELRRQERDAARNLAQLESKATHLSAQGARKLNRQGSVTIGAVEELSTLKDLMEEVSQPVVSSTVAYGSIPAVLSARRSSDSGYAGPERLKKPAMRKCLQLAETRAEEHNVLMQRQAAHEAERLQNFNSDSAKVPPIVVADALQKLVEQVREELPAQSARLKQLKFEHQQTVKRTRLAEAEAGMRRKRFDEAESTSHGAGEESVADALGKLTKQQSDSGRSMVDKIHTLWPLEDLGRQGDAAVQHRKRERQSILGSAAQQHIEGVWRPEGAPAALRTEALYDPRDPASLEERVNSASSNKELRPSKDERSSKRDAIARDPVTRDPGPNLFAAADMPRGLAPYRPDDGLYIYWDFIVGLPAKYQQVRLVYSFWQDKGPVCGVLATEYAPVDGTGNAIFAGRRHVKDVPGTNGTRLAMEMQGTTADASNVPIGWAILNAFGHQLCGGKHRCPLLLPPARVDVEPAAYKWVPRLGQRTALCLRLGLPSQHSRDAQFTVHPMYEGEYAEGSF
jgi:hypothetical protein